MLQFLNAFFQFGLDKRFLKWDSKPAPSPTKKWTKKPKPPTTLKASLTGVKHSSPLVTAIDEYFHSIIYRHLTGYRNWVTHHGAPALPDDGNIFGSRITLTAAEQADIWATMSRVHDPNKYPESSRAAVERANRNVFDDAVTDVLLFR
jgi:hypothetical protein